MLRDTFQGVEAEKERENTPECEGYSKTSRDTRFMTETDGM